MYTTTKKPQESTFLWLTKIIAGLVIVIILGIHFWVNHLVAPGGLLSYSDVLAYYQNPIVPIMEVFFLIFVVAHALLGLRSILLDLNPGKKLLPWINIGFILIGIIAITYGTWLVFFVVAKGSGA